MLYTIPKLADGLRLRPVIDPDGDIAYQLARPGHAAAVQLSPPPVAMLMLIDGESTVQVLYERARAFGMRLPPGALEGLVGALLRSGLAEVAEANALPQRTLPGTEHICEGCGRSCEGHLVGPLPPSEVKTLMAAFPELVARVPRLKGHQPVSRHHGRDGVFLTLVDGRCLFLDDDKRCAVHRHMGAHVKPSICRTFPYVRIYTESGLRAGVGMGCYRHYKHVTRQPDPPNPSAPIDLDGPLATLPPVFTAVVPFGDPPLVGLSPQARAARASMETYEARLWTWIAQPSATLEGLAALLSGDPNPAPQPRAGRIPADAVQLAAEALTEAAAFLDDEASFFAYIKAQDTGLSDAYRSFDAALDAIAEAAESPRDLPLPEDVEILILDQARRRVWLRELAEHALETLLAATVLALWSAPDDASEDEVLEHVASIVTTWFRIVTTDGDHAKLFPKPDAARRLTRAWSAGVT